MSLLLIHQYHSKVEEIMQYGGSRNETAIIRIYDLRGSQL